MSNIKLSFAKVNTVPTSGLVDGRIYFEKSTGLLKIASSSTTCDTFSGVIDASWNDETKILTIIRFNGNVVNLDLSDMASAAQMVTELAKKADLTYVNTQLNTKVDKITGKGLSTNDYTNDEKNKLANIEPNAEVNIIETVKVNNTALVPDANRSVNVIIPGPTVTAVKDGDKVLSLDNTKLSSTLGLVYDKTNKKVKLTGIGSTEIASIDVTDFIKDGMVNEVSFDPSTKILTIQFNTDSGKQSVTVDLTSLVDVYTQGNGITIDSNVVSVDTDVIATVESLNAVKDVSDSAIQEVTVEGTIPLHLTSTRTSNNIKITGSIDEMIGATSSADGKNGLVPAPTSGQQDKFLRGDKTWSVPTDTTYTFANGTDGSFTVTPKGYSGQKIYVGKPSTATTADKVVHKHKIKINGGNTENTNLYTYDGSVDKTLDIVAGTNVTLNAEAGKLTITSKDTIYTHPEGSAPNKVEGFYKFSTDGTSHIKTVTSVTKADIINLLPNTYDAYGSASTAEVNAKNYANSLLEWEEL